MCNVAIAKLPCGISGNCQRYPVALLLCGTYFCYSCWSVVMSCMCLNNFHEMCLYFMMYFSHGKLRNWNVQDLAWFVLFFLHTRMSCLSHCRSWKVYTAACRAWEAGSEQQEVGMWYVHSFMCVRNETFMINIFALTFCYLFGMS